MKKVLITTLAWVSLLAGCKKKSDDPTPTNPTGGSSKSKTEYLTAHSWKLVSSSADKAVDIDGEGTSSTNLMEQRRPCENDNIITFSASPNKTGSLDEGPSKCDNNPQSTNFDWEWNDAETVIKTKTPVFQVTVEEYTVLEINDNTLKVTYGQNDKNDVSYIATDVYTKP